MQTSESIKNIVAAVLQVMDEVKSIDKKMTVGSGQSSYKGVADMDVKKAIGEAMVKYKLTMFPVEIEEETQLTEWDETYNGNTKHKQSIFAKVKTTYMLAHESGEYIIISGYGHGTDSQDKAAGKATTYALKYALLYTFLVPTGKIDDADNTHSDTIPTPQPAKQDTAKSDQNVQGLTNKPFLTPVILAKLVERAKNGEEGIFEKMNANFHVTDAQIQEYKTAINKK